MADNMTPEQRHMTMSKIRSRDTKVELAIRKELHKRGYRFRVNVTWLAGKPDGLEEGADQGSEEVPGTLPATGTERIRFDPRPRPEAHLREKAPGSRCHRGRQAGPAGPQERQHHQSLLGCGAGKTDR